MASCQTFVGTQVVNMPIDVYTDESTRSAEDKFDHLRDEWNSLLRQSASDTVFMTWEWQQVWWRHFGPKTDSSLFLLTMRDAAGQLTGLWPLYDEAPGEGARRLRVIGSPRGSDYLDLIARRGQEQAVYEAALDFMMQREDWASIETINVRDGSPTLEVLAPLAEERGLAVEVERVTVCPGIALPDSWESYLEELSRKQRHEMRRKLRRANQGTQRVEWYLSDDPQSLADDMEVYFELFEKSSYVKEEYLDDQRRAFFRDMAAVMLEAGWLYLAILSINDEIVASMFCFDYGEAISVYNSGFDPQSYRNLSPGIVLLCYCIQDAIDRRYPHFDFLRGDEEYKYRCGAVDQVIYRLTIGRG
jgi:CelD/BcsL family acetyltransferase involved in cellulose biosynthesis